MVQAVLSRETGIETAASPAVRGHCVYDGQGEFANVRRLHSLGEYGE